MSISKKRPLVLTDTDIPTLNRVLAKLYEDINEVINAVNKKIVAEEPNRFEGKLGDIRIVQASNGDYEIQGRTNDGWVYTEMDFKDN
jgi:hypothetical protein